MEYRPDPRSDGPTGRRAVVTGASSGLGEITACELARKGAQVVLAVRDTIKGERSAQRIRSTVPGALVEVRELDLSSLESVRAFATGLVAQSPTLDLLVNKRRHHDDSREPDR